MYILYFVDNTWLEEIQLIKSRHNKGKRFALLLIQNVRNLKTSKRIFDFISQHESGS